MLVLTLLFPSSPEVPFKLRCEMSIQIAVVPLGNRIHVTNMSFCFLEIVSFFARMSRRKSGPGLSFLGCLLQAPSKRWEPQGSGAFDPNPQTLSR